MNKILRETLFLLKMSRPGLWFATVWLYILPTSGNELLFDSWVFWFGLFYVCFPLNLLVYGWNDIVDFEADRGNPRKGNYLFGALADRKSLDRLMPKIILFQLLTYPIFIYFGGIKMLGLLLFQVLVLYAYNHPTRGLRSKPPFELSCQIGYLLIVPFSVWIHDLEMPGTWTFVYLSLFAFQSHLIGEVMDIEPDRAAGKTTSAVVIGMFNTKLLIILIVALEVAIITFVFEDLVFGLLLSGGLLWLLLDLFFIFKTKVYTLFQMKLFGWMSNLVAIASMMYVWWSACLG